MFSRIILAMLFVGAFGPAGSALTVSAQEWQDWETPNRNYYDGPRDLERARHDNYYYRGPRDYYGNYGPYYQMDRRPINRWRAYRYRPKYYTSSPYYAYPAYVYAPAYVSPYYYPYPYIAYPANYYYDLPPGAPVPLGF
jgi:hypothetical protein